MNINDPIAQVVQDLRSRGYIHTFIMMNHGIYCPELSQEVPAEQLTLVESHHVDGPVADAANTHEVFAVTTSDQVKGIMLDTYSEYNASEFAELFGRINKAQTAQA